MAIVGKVRASRERIGKGERGCIIDSYDQWVEGEVGGSDRGIYPSHWRRDRIIHASFDGEHELCRALIRAILWKALLS